MMKSEFENLAGREVTNEQYRAIETLYMSSNLEKAEFVKSIRTMLKSIPQPERKKDIKRMSAYAEGKAAGKAEERRRWEQKEAVAAV